MDNNQKKKLSIFTILAVLLVVVDFASKKAIVSRFELYEQKVFINGFFSFFYVRNTGSAFSFLADKGWGIYVLTAISLIVSVILYYVLIKAVKLNDNITCVAISLFIAGAVGNLIDRAAYKSVVDFIRFDFGSYTFPIFNIADICAVVATILLMGIIIFGKGKMERLLDSFSKEKQTEVKADAA